MPSAADAIKADRSNLTPIDNTQQAEQKPPAALSDSRVNSLLKSPYARCPLPASNNSADSLRQWGQGTDVPVFRTSAPPLNSNNGGGNTTINSSATSSSSSGGTTPATLPSSQNASISTPTLAPGQTWTGSLQMAKSFILVQVTGSAFCRIELYGTKIAQTLDLGRPVTQGPPNTTRGLILDVALLTAKTWQVLDCVGSNDDSTRSATIYVTITNLSTGAGKITTSLLFVPEES
jgi:hypothetical protein